MDNEQLLKSLIKWLKTFKVGAPHNSVEELSDGVAMAQILAQVAPEWFDSMWLTKIKNDATSNWRLKVSNLKKILEGILDYYAEILGQQIIDFKLPDVNAIGEHNDAAELARLLQLILGCVVNCDHKQEYIQTIMGMEEADQHVVMSAIQELMMKETDTTNPELSEITEQLKRLMEELQLANEAKEQIAQRCHALDLQVATLQDEKQNLITENEKLSEKLSQAEGLDDLSSAAGRRNQALQHQVEQLQEELYRLESSRDEYRLKVDQLELELRELQEKNDELQRSGAELRLLKDEIDVLREKADKATKYESNIESYKKKLEDLSDMKRQLKLSEEKNTVYMQQNMELETELKRNATLRGQLDMYKKKVQELHGKLSDETKKADRAEFEKKKVQEKLTAIEREKERLVAERDTLKEINEELKLAQIQKLTTVQVHADGHPSSVDADGEVFEMIPPVVKEELIRLRHEIKMLKLNREGSDEEQIQVLQTMLDDSKERQSELETESRLSNQRILELESQLEEIHNNQSNASTREDAELRQKVSSSLEKIREVELDLRNKNSQIEQQEKLLTSNSEKIRELQETINKKDDEILKMDTLYKKYLEKAKSVCRQMDPKQTPLSAPDILALKNQLQEKDKFIQNLEKESKESKAMREMEEKLITTAFHNLGMRLQRRAVEERLTNVTSRQSFLARQRQATSRRMGVGFGQSDFFEL